MSYSSLFYFAVLSATVIKLNIQHFSTLQFNSQNDTSALFLTFQPFSQHFDVTLDILALFLKLYIKFVVTILYLLLTFQVFSTFTMVFNLLTFLLHRFDISTLFLTSEPYSQHFFLF